MAAAAEAAAAPIIMEQPAVSAAEAEAAVSPWVAPVALDPEAEERVKYQHLPVLEVRVEHQVPILDLAAAEAVELLELPSLSMMEGV